jgi:hypothetical protein
MAETSRNMNHVKEWKKEGRKEGRMVKKRRIGRK